MSLSIALFERQPQSIAVCYLYPLSPSQNTTPCYLVSSALTLKALKGKTAEGENNRCIYNHVAVSVFPSNPPYQRGLGGCPPSHSLAVSGFFFFFFPCPSLEQDRGETLHTFFLNDQKESVQRKSRRHRFIGQFLHHNIYG